MSHVCSMMLAILSAVSISFVISRRFSEPLSQLAAATKEISKGNFKKTIPEQGKKDELGLLVTSFNSMTKQLDSATQNAENNQHRLELSRMFLDTILTNLSSGVIVIDQGMRIRLHNPAGLKTLKLIKIFSISSIVIISSTLNTRKTNKVWPLHLFLAVVHKLFNIFRIHLTFAQIHLAAVLHLD